MTLTGGEYDNYEFKYKWEDFCVISIIRAGCSMINEAFELMPGVAVGKILIQRDENTEHKSPVFFYEKVPKSISKKH